jgi:hypothetical protein
LVIQSNPDEQLRVLKWIHAQGETTDRIHDSDLMRGLDLTLDQAQGLLAALRRQREVRYETLLLPAGGYTFVKVRLRTKGLSRATGEKPEAGLLQRVRERLAKR